MSSTEDTIVNDTQMDLPHMKLTFVQMRWSLKN